MNRRQFLKSALIGLAGLFVPRVPLLQQGGYVNAVITDREGFCYIHRLPISVWLGDGTLWHTENIFDPTPIWEQGAAPSIYFVNPRLRESMGRFLERRWAA